MKKCSDFLLPVSKIATIRCLRIFLAVVQKKPAFFKLLDCQKIFTILQRRKKAFTQADSALEMKHYCKHGR